SAPRRCWRSGASTVLTPPGRTACRREFSARLGSRRRRLGASFGGGRATSFGRRFPGGGLQAFETRLGHLLELLQRRQVAQAAEPELHQELARGAVEDGLAHHFLAP